MHQNTTFDISLYHSNVRQKTYYLCAFQRSLISPYIAACIFRRPLKAESNLWPWHNAPIMFAWEKWPAIKENRCSLLDQWKSSGGTQAFEYISQKTRKSTKGKTFHGRTTSVSYSIKNLTVCFHYFMYFSAVMIKHSNTKCFNSWSSSRAESTLWSKLSYEEACCSVI